MKDLVLGVLLVNFICLQCRIEALESNNLETIRFLNCPQRNLCSKMKNNSFKERLCECDSECALYGDCCIDADRSSWKTSPQFCMQFGDNVSQAVYVINTCPSTYAGDDAFQRLCLEDDFHDLVKSAPVTDTSNQKIYLNHYCAICNGALLNGTTSWTTSTCKAWNVFTESLPLENILYVSREKKWGYHVNGSFQPCRILYNKPPSVSGIGRSCKPKLISFCPNTWGRQDYVDKCRTYMAVVKDSKNNLFKNPHCALCNGVAESELTCVVESRLKKRGISFPFALMYNYRMRNSNKGMHRAYLSAGGESFPCPDGQQYDNYFKKCRPLVCALPGYFRKNGRCVKQ